MGSALIFCTHNPTEVTGLDERITPADEHFRLSLERCEIPNNAFRHRDHLRLAWIYLRHDPETAARRVGESIRRFASHWGVGRKYHETLSHAWVRIVAIAIAETPDAADFESFVAVQPHLLDKKLPLRHYTPGRLWNDAAREGWVEPDLRPFPG
jgi:hypothetical protein